MTLDPALKAFATSPNFAALTTLRADGSPSTHVMWIDADDEHLLLNTEIDRQKLKNMQRDPRVAITVMDAESPYRYIEARGRVVDTVGGQEARDHIDACSRRYTGKDYNPDAIKTERVIVKVAVDHVYNRAGH